MSELDGMECWTINGMKFNKDKCCILNLGQGNARHRNRLAEELLKSSSTEKDREVLIDSRFNTTR